MSRTSTLGRTATTAARDSSGTLRVTYHRTVVVEADKEGFVTLDSGGWRTVTTKLRMNQAANQYGLGYAVSQRKGEWFVQMRGKDGKVYREIAFSDGMRFKP